MIGMTGNAVAAQDQPDQGSERISTIQCLA